MNIVAGWQKVDRELHQVNLMVRTIPQGGPDCAECPERTDSLESGPLKTAMLVPVCIIKSRLGNVVLDGVPTPNVS